MWRKTGAAFLDHRPGWHPFEKRSLRADQILAEGEESGAIGAGRLGDDGVCVLGVENVVISQEVQHREIPILQHHVIGQAMTKEWCLSVGISIGIGAVMMQKHLDQLSRSRLDGLFEIASVCRMLFQERVHIAGGGFGGRDLTGVLRVSHAPGNGVECAGCHVVCAFCARI